MELETVKPDVPSLTPSETLLLEFLGTPDSVGMSVMAICDKLQITTATYYRAFKKDYFVRQLQDVAVGIVHSAVLPVLHKAKEEALGGARNNFHWAKMLMEMSGLYIPSKAAQVKADIQVIINMPRPDGQAKVINMGPVQEIASDALVSDP
jgi:hypothetical protein